MTGTMTHHQRSRKRDLSGLIALVLFGVFAVCILSVLLTGADVYRGLTARDQGTYARRTSAQYVATKVRQAYSGDAVEVADFGGTDALFLTEEIEGEPYVTRIYCYDGWLRELFTAENAEFDPEDGEMVCEAQEMELSMVDDLLRIHIVNADGQSEQLELFMRGREAAE